MDQSQGQPSSDARTMAMLAHLLALFTGFLGPLILYLVKKDDDPFIRFHALQALYFELIGIPLAIVTCGLWVLAMLVFNILGIVHANAGEWWKLPIAGNWAWPERT
jgi:hypothetical protein